MLKERQSREGIQSNSKDSEPTLVLPQLAKVDTKAYFPGEFYCLTRDVTQRRILPVSSIVSLET